jgi:cyanophycin synthetase
MNMDLGHRHRYGRQHPAAAFKTKRRSNGGDEIVSALNTLEPPVTTTVTEKKSKSRRKTPSSDTPSQTRRSSPLHVIRVLRGSGFGQRQPVILLRVAMKLPDAPNADALNTIFAPLFALPLYPDVKPAPIKANASRAHIWVARLLHWTKMLQQAADIPTFEDGRVLSLETNANGLTQCFIVLPYAEDRPRVAQRAFHWIIGAAQRYTSVPLSVDDQTSIKSNALQIIESLQTRAPRGSNTTPFLRAAHMLGIPSSVLSGNTYQFGWGARARWLDSTFTDRTSRLGSGFARSKMQATHLLAQAGLPVPRHLAVPDLAAAEHAAHTLGFPVVVKPADKDGGVGVSAGLHNIEHVRSAFARARQHSKSVLVEQHIEGQDYRLHVQNGRTLAATLRSPGSVTGDGISSIKTLLDLYNADPHRGSRNNSPLKLLALDEEARELLEAADLTSDSIPAKDAIIRLRRGANITRGGTPTNVNDRVHPDNARLAERAAATLRLDCAGIDLLIPDISVSWRESGGAICEVNGQPRISRLAQPQLFGEILKLMLPNDGRFPIVLIVGNTLADDTATALASALRTEMPRRSAGIGLATSSTFSIGGENLCARPTEAYEIISTLLAAPDTEAAIVTLSDASLLDAGLPCDRYDLLILAENTLPNTDALQRLFGMIAPNRRGPIIVNQDDEICFNLAHALPANQKVLARGDANALANEAIARLRQTAPST